MTRAAALAGPRGRLLTGNLHEFAQSPLDFLTHAAREYGPVVRLRFARRRALLLNDPALIEHVMVTRWGSRRDSRPTEELHIEIVERLDLEERGKFRVYRSLVPNVTANV